MYKAEIVEDSISPAGVRLVTFSLSYPRFVHDEFLTHRVFTRSSSSSRAIPIIKMIKRVWNNPATFVSWGKNCSGMQAKTELSSWRKSLSMFLWNLSAKVQCVFAYIQSKLGAHKQIANRHLDTYTYINTVMTATELDNWFALRDHPDAQPEIRQLAVLMKEALDKSTPKKLKPGEWHLPYVTEEERNNYSLDVTKALSAARCARVSYLNHEGKEPDINKDLDTHNKLRTSRPLHASPFEHQATPDTSRKPKFIRNFRGWIQNRVDVEKEIADAE